MAKHEHASSPKYVATMALGALGVVYGDIGTSPLYALKESFRHLHHQPSAENVLGILSLIVWSLILIVTVKYLIFVMRADNDGEGGILALTSLIVPIGYPRDKKHWWLLMLGLFGTALLYGDGVITPAISVLGAIEGLNVATPVFEHYLVPIAIVILVGLFSIQSRGTGTVGKIFGPIIVVWLIVMAVLGIGGIVRAPAVLGAISPHHAVRYLFTNGWRGFIVLGSVFLAITGAEALYADMGHFGRRPIRLAWATLVLPALLLNYFGQGALVLTDKSAVENPFFKLAPQWAIYPLVLLATLAAIIASQALISGAFSLTRQAVQLGFSPRVDIEHTSAREIGQIYIPGVNWALMLACIVLVLGFRSSSALAAAYGIAVTLTMLITTMLFYFVARERWKWPAWRAAAVAGFFWAIEFMFFAANVVKIPEGGWFPLVVGGLVFTAMTTWNSGRRILGKRLRRTALPLDRFLHELHNYPPYRVPGTAIYMTGNPEFAPVALLHNLRHFKVLHQRVIILNVKTEEGPHCKDDQRVQIRELGDNIFSMEVHYGFIEDPDIPKALEIASHNGFHCNPNDTTFVLGRERLYPTNRPGMALWREKLFALMNRNARGATYYFNIPPDRVIEVGMQVEL
jgi:KUP system potassium uptake protein